MKKMKLAFGIYIAFFVFGLFIAPIFAIYAHPFTNFDAVDNVDDVYYNDVDDLENPDDIGDYADGIDIISVNVTGGNLVVTFQGDDPPRSGNDYLFWFHLDIDNDGSRDYRLTYYSSVSDYYLLNLMTGHANYTKTWDGTGKNWSSGSAYLISTDIGNTVTLQDIELALNTNGHTLTTAKFTLYVEQKNATNSWFADYLPDPSGGGIPGFHLIPILFSLVMLVSFITIYKYKRL